MKVIEKNKQDKNVKYVLELDDGAYIESSLFVHQNGLHYCVPTQVGCPLRCYHCSTTYSAVPYIRQMENSEMTEMVELMMNDSEERSLPQILSFSGHGEPMLNWDTVSYTMDCFREKFSTYYATSVGIFSMFERVLQGDYLPDIYFSVHGSNDAERRKIIRQHENPQIANIEQIFGFGRSYVKKGGKIIWNYMVCPFNSSEDSKMRLAELSERLDYPLEIRFMKYVDIGIENGITESSDDEVFEMYDTVAKLKNPFIQARKSYLEGTEMGIACGQLRAHAESMRIADNGGSDCR